MLVGSANEYLPFDVLGHIFSDYASEENIKYPLETLLLVCKPWSRAALGHRTLWKHLKIYIGHEPTPTIWTARLPLRLARCGPDVSLDIDLRNQVHFEPHGSFVFGEGRKNCSCYIAATACTKLSLQALTGRNGEICARWRSLTLQLGPRQYDEVRIALSHATPILEKLELENVRFLGEDPNLHLFPQVHSLKHLSLDECHLPSLPSCDNLLNVSLSWEELHTTFPDFSSLRSARKLQSLSLQSSFVAYICLPTQLPDLRVLMLQGYSEIDLTDIFTCQMPQISHLSLEYEGYNLLDQVLHCEGLPIEKLTRLSLKWGSGCSGEDEIPALMDSLCVILIRVRDLEYLDAGDDFVSIVIKVLWNSLNELANPNLVTLDDSAGPVLKDVCLTNTSYGDNDSVQLDGNETTSLLEELATKWKCVDPNLPDEQFAEKLKYLFDD